MSSSTEVGGPSPSSVRSDSLIASSSPFNPTAQRTDNTTSSSSNRREKEAKPQIPPDEQPQQANTNGKTSFFGHIAYPISYTTSSLLRRLSEDSAPTPLARALSANYNGLMSEYQPPPKRKLSPFQPPPLTPLTLDGYKESTSAGGRLLSKALAEEIRLLVPPRLQLVDTWKLGYSLEQDGSSLKSLFSSMEAYKGKRGGFVLVVRDAAGGIFGAYLSDPPHPYSHYYGTGESFLWRAQRLSALPDLASLPPPPSADTTNMTRSTTIGLASKNSSSASLASLNPASALNGTSQKNSTRTPERIRFKAFPYTGENDFTILCQQGFLSVGGGDGKYGLWLDDSLAKGVSAGCPTFMNEGLSDEGEKFGILGVEIWYIGS